MACNSCEVVLQREQREAKQTLADVWSLCLMMFDETIEVKRCEGKSRDALNTDTGLTKEQGKKIGPT